MQKTIHPIDFMDRDNDDACLLSLKRAIVNCTFFAWYDCVISENYRTCAQNDTEKKAQ
jgi:hypothetical protein